MAEDCLKKFGSIVLILIQFAATITCFVFSLLVAKKIKYTYEYVEDYASNNEQIALTLTGIQFITEQEQCGLGLKELPFGKFNGIIAGCKIGEVIEKGPCKSEGTPIVSLPESNITTWRGFKICYNPDVKKKYIDYLNYAKKESCSLGFTDCGILDDHNQHLCIPTGEICPINFLKIATEEPLQCQGITCRKYEIPNSEYKVFYSNEYRNGHVIAKLVISDDSLCAKPGLLVSNSNYILEQNVVPSSSSCPKITSQNYITDERISDLVDEYEKNKLAPYNNLPSYPAGNTKLYTYPYIGYDSTKKRSRVIMSYSRLDSYKKYIKDLDKFALVTFIFQCICLGWSFIKSIIQCCTKKEDDDDKDKDKNPMGCLGNLLDLCGLVSLIFSIICLVKACKATYDLNGYTEFSMYLIKENLGKVIKARNYLIVMVVLQSFYIALAVLICACSCLVVCCLGIFGSN